MSPKGSGGRRSKGGRRSQGGRPSERPSIDALLRKLVRSGLRRGLSGEHWMWLVVAGTAFAFLRARRHDDAVTTIDLQPGERYVVSLLEPGTPHPPKG